MSPAAKRAKRPNAKDKAATASRSRGAKAPPAKGKGAKGAKAAAPGSARTNRPASKAPGDKERRHCIATDPFGDPCQSVPRLPSKYCTIHSYLDR